MPQVLKEEVRERILGAALASFARHGYAGTTMGALAQQAGMAVANLYRYYPSKDELFEAAVPAELVERFERLLEKSVAAHAQLAGLSRTGEEAGKELLDFWIAHRLVVVILLDRASGTPHEGFAVRFVERLVALTLAQVRSLHPGIVVSKEARLVLSQVFENTRRMISTLLERCEGEAAIRRAVAAFRSYQMGGLVALMEWMAVASP
jgi:AcrR family transcriptional regulator